MGWLSYPAAADVPAEDWPWPNFTPDEMACSHTGAIHLSRASMDRLQALRRKLGRPLVITSGYRHPTHPVEAKKEHGPGAHASGQAFDIAWWGGDYVPVITLARSLGFLGIGVADHGDRRFIHVDDWDKRRGQPESWTYA